MKVYKDGAQIVIEESPLEPTRIVNINSAWSCMDQVGTEVIIINARTDQGWRDDISNITDSGGTPLTVSELRAIIGS